MEHKLLSLISLNGSRHSHAIQSCSHSCKFTNLIEEQRPDQSAFLKSSGSKALQIRFIDWQMGGEWENGI